MLKLRRNGQISAIIATALVVAFIFTAFTANLGIISAKKNQLSQATESASLLLASLYGSYANLIRINADMSWGKLCWGDLWGWDFHCKNMYKQCEDTPTAIIRNLVPVAILLWLGLSEDWFAFALYGVTKSINTYLERKQLNDAISKLNKSLIKMSGEIGLKTAALQNAFFNLVNDPVLVTDDTDIDEDFDVKETVPRAVKWWMDYLHSIKKTLQKDFGGVEEVLGYFKGVLNTFLYNVSKNENELYHLDFHKEIILPVFNAMPNWLKKYKTIDENNKDKEFTAIDIEEYFIKTSDQLMQELSETFCKEDSYSLNEAKFDKLKEIIKNNPENSIASFYSFAYMLLNCSKDVGFLTSELKRIKADHHSTLQLPEYKEFSKKIDSCIEALTINLEEEIQPLYLAVKEVYEQLKNYQKKIKVTNFNKIVYGWPWPPEEMKHIVKIEASINAKGGTGPTPIKTLPGWEEAVAIASGPDIVYAFEGIQFPETEEYPDGDYLPKIVGTVCSGIVLSTLGCTGQYCTYMVYHSGDATVKITRFDTDTLGQGFLNKIFHKKYELVKKTEDGLQIKGGFEGPGFFDPDALEKFVDKNGIKEQVTIRYHPEWGVGSKHY